MVLDEPQASDIVKDIDGISFVVDEKLDDQYDVVKVDYQKTLFSKGFIITLDGRSTSCS